VSGPAPLLPPLREALAFEPAAARVGNLTWGRGTLDGRVLHVALIENFIASGSIGHAEAQHLVELFEHVARDRAPIVLYIDSAGARVSEGLKALGGFRHLYRAGLEAAFAGSPIAAVLGRNCFGGASMLAHLAQARLFGPTTQLAMSGPAVIAAASGLDATDEMYRAMAAAAFAPAARARTSAANAVWDAGRDITDWLRTALAPCDPTNAFRARHAALASRLEGTREEPLWKVMTRPELSALYARHDVQHCDGVIAGRGERDGGEQSFVGIVDDKPVDAVRAWRFAEQVWRHAERPPGHLEVFLDCASHAARLEEEKRILSEFIVDMAAALFALRARGTRVGLTITGRAGGGVYVALAAPAHRVASVYARARIEVLPGAAVAAILGESRDQAPSFGEYRSAGVADDELKLGFVPGKP